MNHFSRWSEELVLWMSQQFSFVDLPDRFCTGSSIMPQKKNPDVPELIRGKSARVTGNLVSLLTLMKGQPLAYNKDNQEDKEPLFDAVDTLRDALTALNGMLPAIRANAENMRRAAASGFTTATDLADYLVRLGVPFRDAHEVVGQVVAHAIAVGRSLEELSLEELQRFHQQIGADVFDVLTLDGSVAARDHVGATAPRQVRSAVSRARSYLREARAPDDV
jgi:argininosuccinate lyase